MERLKVPDLKAEAKRLRLRRFSRLRKAELIDIINQARARLPNILDEPVPEINAQILQPTRALEKNPEERRRRKEPRRLTEEETNRRLEIKKFEEMLGLRRPTQSRPPPEIKISSPEETEKDRKIRKIKEINRRSRTTRITETETAFRGFARQFRIERDGNHGGREFMQIVKPDVLQIMIENRQTRVRAILNCFMSRKELFSENIEFLAKYFHSETIENIDGVNESPVFNSFIETERFKLET